VDYTRQPIGALFRGPLLHTPQGLAVLTFSVIYLLLAALFGLADVPAPQGWRLANIVGICLSWPIVLFLMFLKYSQPSFAPSWSGALWLTICALAPVAITLWRS
jgi:hypothetical protein